MPISETSEKLIKTTQVLKDRLATIRAARAQPSLLESVDVEAYGTKMKLIELSSIISPDPQLLIVQPWDASLTDPIVKALEAANLGLNPIKEANTIRIPIPPLSQERREQLVKTVSTWVEEARVAVRQIRQEAMRDIEKMESVGDDEKFRLKKEIEEHVQKANEEIGVIGQRKKSEIQEI